MKWIIASNVLPFKINKATNQVEKNSGGLVSAITGIHTKEKMAWVGIGEEDARFAQQNSRFTYHPIAVNKKTYHCYYNGFCNETLWPLFHYATDSMHYSEEAWQAYININTLFAEKIAQLMEKDDVLWIHDFHLLLLPQLLRARCPNVKIGFFLHIPFPSPEVFRCLPHSKLLLEGVMASNLIAFNDEEYKHLFKKTVRALCDVCIDNEKMTVNERTHKLRLIVCPAGIDVKKFKGSSSVKNTSHVAHLFDTKKTILGVDRLDPIKGLDLKVQAFEYFLQQFPEYHGKISLVQIAIPTRATVEEYKKLKIKIEASIESVNKKYGSATYIPIKYLYASIKFTELCHLYRNSDVLWVTSKRDGLNLVGKEYLISQKTQSPGVLLLSEFTGLASVLPGCLKFNPWDSVDSANQLHYAINLNQADRSRLHRQACHYIMQHSATNWAEECMSQLISNISKQKAYAAS